MKNKLKQITILLKRIFFEYKNIHCCIHISTYIIQSISIIYNTYKHCINLFNIINYTTNNKHKQ